MDETSLELTRRLVLDILSVEASEPQLGSLPTFVRDAEQIVLSCLAARAVEIVAITTRCRPIGQNQFVAQSGERFIVATSEAGLQHTAYNFDVLSLEATCDPRRPTVRRTAKIASPGRFKRLNVNVPTELAACATPLAQHGQLLLNSGYSWIADKIRTLAEATELRVGDGLYLLAKEVFPEIRLRREIWFATVGPLYGFRLVAPEVVDGALQVYAERANSLPLSALDLLAQLLASCLPRDLLLMDAAARQNQTIDVDVSDAGYARLGSTYTFVMKGLYRGTSFTIFPILRRNQLAVMALFPTGSNLIKGRLELHRDRFHERANTLATAIIEAASLFEVHEPADRPDDTDLINQGNVAHVLGRAVDSIRVGGGAARFRLFRRRRI